MSVVANREEETSGKNTNQFVDMKSPLLCKIRKVLIDLLSHTLVWYNPTDPSKIYRHDFFFKIRTKKKTKNKKKKTNKQTDKKKKKKKKTRLTLFFSMLQTIFRSNGLIFLDWSIPNYIEYCMCGYFVN